MIMSVVLALLIVALCIGLLSFGLRRRITLGCCLGRIQKNGEDCSHCPIAKLAGPPATDDDKVD